MKKLLIILFIDLIFLSSYDWTCQKVNLDQKK